MEHFRPTLPDSHSTCDKALHELPHPHRMRSATVRSTAWRRGTNRFFQYARLFQLLALVDLSMVVQPACMRPDPLAGQSHLIRTGHDKISDRRIKSGADRNRTCTPVRELDPKSSASASSATAPLAKTLKTIQGLHLFSVIFIVLTPLNLNVQ